MFRKNKTITHNMAKVESNVTLTLDIIAKKFDIPKVAEWWKEEHQKLAIELVGKLNIKLKELGYSIDKLEITF